MIGRDLGCDEQAGDFERLFAGALIMAGDGEKSGYRLRVADLEELAHFGFFAEALVEIAKNVGHGAGLGALPGNLTVHDLATTGWVDGMKLLGAGKSRSYKKCDE